MEIIETNLTPNGTLQERSSTDRIFLHHAAAYECSVEDIDRWHKQNGWTMIGYHFLVRKDGSIYRGRPEWAVGAHAQGSNYNSIGICFEGNFDEEYMNNEQIKAGIDLVNYLKDKYSIDWVQRHSEVNNTSCPGDNFPFETIANTEEPAPQPVYEDDSTLRYQKAYNLTYGKHIAEDNIRGPETNESLQHVLLKRYCENELVYWCQERIKNYKGYSLGVDGKFGRETESVVRQFQLDNNIAEDGIIGPVTCGLLLK